LLALALALACAEDPGKPLTDADQDRWYDHEDCDDSNAAVNPGVPETPYNGVDDDCDPGTPDDDLDGDGFLAADDCDDQDASSVPTEERCNGIDDDCDGTVDEDATDRVEAWTDGDGDGWSAGDPVLTCEVGAGQAARDGDCADADPAVHPEAEEVCNGADDDCDLQIDEGLPDASGYTDLDGDGWGDAAAEDCDTDTVAEGGDCADDDPDVYPGAMEVLDGVDNDCDGITDEHVVVIVIGYQCQDWGDASWVDEKATIEGYLDDLGLGYDEIDEDGSTGEDEASVIGYDLALFAKCGRSWESYNQDMVDGFRAARNRGTSTFFFDDDSAYRMDLVTGVEELVRLRNAADNGSYSSTATVDSTSTHPAYLGAWGTPRGFLYNWDMDRTSTLGSGEVVLGTHSGTYPWWLVWEDGTTGARSATVLASLLTCNEGAVGADATAQLEIVFKNTVVWLLGGS